MSRTSDNHFRNRLLRGDFIPFIDSQGAKLYCEETGSGTPVVWIQEFAQTTAPGKPRFAGRKGQIEPTGRTPMNVRYTSTPAIRRPVATVIDSLRRPTAAT